MIKGKRGQEGGGVPILGIILIVILIVAIMFFTLTTTGKNLLTQITGGIFNKVNVDTIKQSCELACSTMQTNDWCNAERNIVYLDADKKPKSGETIICKNWATDTRNSLKFGIKLEPCPNIQCA